MLPFRSSSSTTDRNSAGARDDDSGSGSDRRQYSALGMRGGLGKTLLTAFLLLTTIPLGLVAFATYNQIQN
ncbi:MAG: hypothetical protein JXM73_05725, partial [Anaerolineae bacterium]|nr:hypothetical protein [Anaerolineae bacterium]